MDPIRLARPRSRRTFGAPGPLRLRQHTDAIRSPFCSLYLIGEQSGLAKAKPLTMHNKTLIRIVCPDRHRRWANLAPCDPGTGGKRVLGTDRQNATISRLLASTPPVIFAHSGQA